MYLSKNTWLIDSKKLVNFKVFLEDENFISEGKLWYTQGIQLGVTKNINLYRGKSASKV